MTDHDGLYHQLYAHPLMMADLVRQFVNEPWVADLDLDRMEPVKSKFHVPGLPKRESDVIWRIPLRSGADVYLLFMLEFQSEPDRWMVLRVLVYMCLLWLQLIHEKKIPSSGPLPPLFPVVLHNGDDPWLTPVRVKDLIGLPEGSPLWHYQPDGQFFLIDEGRFPKADLEKRDSLSSLVFMVEQCASPEALPALAEAIIAWLEDHPEFAELRQVMAAMLVNAMTSLGVDQPALVNNSINLLEVPTMLQTRMEAWKKQKEQEWRQEWHQEWAASFLLRLLQRRFGTLSESTIQRVQAADQSTLEMWGDRILDARSLDEIFLG